MTSFVIYHLYEQENIWINYIQLLMNLKNWLIWNFVTVILLRLWSCRTAWSTLSRSSRGPRLERRAGELTPEKTSRTEWMNTTTPNPSLDKLLSLWKHTGGNTLSASQVMILDHSKIISLYCKNYFTFDRLTNQILKQLKYFVSISSFRFLKSFWIQDFQQTFRKIWDSFWQWNPFWIFSIPVPFNECFYLL